jgi:type IV pilus assembly protein PilX
VSVRPEKRQRGIVLVSSLLLLVVVTIIALSMFRSMGVQELIAGNIREKHRALHSAESAEQYAEWWLTSGNNVNLVGACIGPLLNGNLNQGIVCSNPLQTVVIDVSTVPWQGLGGELGTSYTPPGMNINVASATGTFYEPPRFYIALLGPAPGGAQGNVYQINAWGYGGSPNSVAVVESTYLVSNGVKDLGGL